MKEMSKLFDKQERHPDFSTWGDTREKPKYQIAPPYSIQVCLTHLTQYMVCNVVKTMAS